jgi:predicted O-methyltransferase YrrM
MDLIYPPVQEYAERFSSPEDPILRDISFRASSHPQSKMLSGHLQGRLLELISSLLRPQRILEIGTFLGYSAICLSRGLAPGGLLHTIELGEDEAREAWNNFSKANALDKIILHRGNALDIIPGLEESWDLVFIDADKGNYLNYYQLVFPKVRVGGLIIADNVLFHGEVLNGQPASRNGQAIQRFNEALQKDGAVDRVFLTLRDGLLLIRKK